MAVRVAGLRQREQIHWTPRLIRLLRGKRTQTGFGALIGAPKNTVWRWEAGHVRPDPTYARRLSAIAERERFLSDWRLVGSMSLTGPLDSAKAEIANLFRKSLQRTARQLGK